MAKSKQHAKTHLATVMQLLLSLGFIINLQKSINAGAGISRIHPKFQQNDDLTTISQIAFIKEISHENEGSGENHPGNCTDYRNDGSDSSSNLQRHCITDSWRLPSQQH